MFHSVGAHLIGQSAEDLLVMSLTDALNNHVPQVPQHGHEWKRLIVCTGERLFINMHDHRHVCVYVLIDCDSMCNFKCINASLDSCLV